MRADRSNRFRSITTQPVFDASLFVDIRKRLGGQEFEVFNQRIIEASEQIKPHQSRIKRKQQQQKEEGTDKDKNDRPEKNDNRGTLKVDATAAGQESTYPTDLKLINIPRENLERIPVVPSAGRWNKTRNLPQDCPQALPEIRAILVLLNHRLYLIFI